MLSLIKNNIILKNYLLISLCLLSINFYGQIEFAQTYYYSNALDNSKNFNYNLYCQNNSIFTIPYSGGINILRNLGEVPFIDNRYKYKPIAIYSDSTVLSLDREQLLIKPSSQNKIITQNIPFFINSKKRIFVNEILYFISSKNDAIYAFSDGKFTMVKKLDQSLNFRWHRQNNKSYIYSNKNDSVNIYEFVDINTWKKIYAGKIRGFKHLIYTIKDTIYYKNSKSEIYQFKNNRYQLINEKKESKIFNHWLITNESGHYQLESIRNKNFHSIPIRDNIRNMVIDDEHQTAYFATNNKMARSFFYLSKIPNVFNGNSSKSCFTLAENSDGDIYAGSYDQNLSIIKEDTIISIEENLINYLVGNVCYDSEMYFTGERAPYNGIWKLDKKNHFELVKGSAFNNQNGYYLYKANDERLYYGTQANGLWSISKKDLKNNNGNWQKIGINKEDNILTITQDNYGRIYYGGSRGIGFYNPKTNFNQYYLRESEQTEISSMCSTTDFNGVIWIGGVNGLFYLRPTVENPKITEFEKLDHPLVNDNMLTTALTIHNDKLIISKQDKILVLDLEKFHKSKEVNLKYLTSQETNFSAIPEQNALLTAQDNSIWFSTTDMIYHWDFESWIKIPKNKIKPKIILLSQNKKQVIQNEEITLHPKENSFKLHIDYYSEDRLPRYISYAFQNENDSLNWSMSTTDNLIQANNLKAGHYKLHLKIFELDGTTSYYQSQIIIPLFWHERWYFWVLLAFLIISIASLMIHQNQEKKLALERINTYSANWEKEKEVIQKKLINSQLNAISNQFKPHFLLNTFNTIGANLEINSKEETLLDSLGSSINILFSMTEEGKNYHSLSREWLLVNNNINIYKITLLKSLTTILPTEESIHKYRDLNIPYGLLQIPVENALLHGLNNKGEPPYILKIKFKNDKNYFIASIEDNGIGIKKSKTLTNMRKNGTGLKNLLKIINIFNNYNDSKIEFIIENSNEKGTKIIIKVPLNYNYNISNYEF